MGLYFYLSLAKAVAARQPEHDPVFAVHRQAVHQPGPQALIELGDELRQVLHALNEPLDLPAADLPREYSHPAVFWKKSLDIASSIYYN